VLEYFYWMKSFPFKTHLQKWKLNEDYLIGWESLLCLHALLISGEAVSGAERFNNRLARSESQRCCVFLAAPCRALTDQRGGLITWTECAEVEPLCSTEYDII
jgi:hypothetical protein